MRASSADRRTSTAFWSIRRAAVSERCRPDRSALAAPARRDRRARGQSRPSCCGPGAARLRPGGSLVYSVCTVSRREADAVVDGLVGERDEFSCEHRWQLLPSTDGDRRVLHCTAPDVQDERVTFGTWTRCTRFSGRHARTATSRGCDRPRLRALPLPVLPEPLRASVRLPQLRRAFDDRAHVDDRDRGMQPLPGQHAQGSVTGARA